MRIREKDTEEEAPVNLMPLIDMVFLLLIFFLVATTFAQEERDINIQLPGTSSVQPLSAAPPQLILNIAADGTVKIGLNVYKWQDLANELARVARHEPNREVLVRCDERAQHGYFAAVVDLCRKVGIPEAKIGYMRKEEKLVKVE